MKSCFQVAVPTQSVIRQIFASITAFGGNSSTVKNGKEVTEADFLSMLSIPVEPDLIIRTGGEKRLSNFLLYQGSYAELFFSDKMFPDFSVEDLEEAFSWYGNRKRKYGLVSTSLPSLE